MVIASELVEEKTARRYKNHSTNEFEDWLSRFMLLRGDGRWVADRRAPRLLPPGEPRGNNWRWSVTADYLDQQLTTDDAHHVLFGEWANGETDAHETVSIRSALVSTLGASSLLAALQTAEKFDRIALPYASDRAGVQGESESNAPVDKAVDVEGTGDIDADEEDKEDVNAGALKLTGWLTDQSGEARLDEYDPWAEGMRFPGPAPSAETVKRLGLQWSEERSLWETAQGGMVRTELSVQVRASRRNDETVPGTRLSANTQFLRELLTANPGRTLIVSVEVRRHPSQYERDDDGNYPQPCVRYYLMGDNGVATTL
jgi:hypothetical protein